MKRFATVTAALPLLVIAACKSDPPAAKPAPSASSSAAPASAPIRGQLAIWLDGLEIGFERYEISGLDDGLQPRATLTVTATAPDGGKKQFSVRCRIDTPEEGLYFRNGGILPYVLRNLVKQG